MFLNKIQLKLKYFQRVGTTFADRWLCASFVQLKKKKDGGKMNEPGEDFDGEPGVADALDVEEGVVGVGLRLVQRPGRGIGRRLHRDVADHRHPHVRMRLEAKRQDRYADEEDRDQAHDLFSKAKKTFIHSTRSFFSKILKNSKKFQKISKKFQKNFKKISKKILKLI